jgi:hypothetical protein
MVLESSLRERVLFSYLCTLALSLVAATATGTVSTTGSATATSSQSVTRTGTPTATFRPTTISSTRFTIDAFNRASIIQSDAARVSAGCRDVFSDNRGSLITTAVLIKSPAGQPGDLEWTYRPTRVDILLYIFPGQSRTAVNDLVLTLYEDDGSEARFPGTQVCDVRWSSSISISRTQIMSFVRPCSLRHPFPWPRTSQTPCLPMRRRHGCK